MSCGGFAFKRFHFEKTECPVRMNLARARLELRFRSLSILVYHICGFKHRMHRLGDSIRMPHSKSD
jgi:hypothetical protein